jgi:hypothetical protein
MKALAIGIVVNGVFGCGASSPSPQATTSVEAAPSVKLAVSRGSAVRIVEASVAGLQVTRTVSTPGTTIDALVWGAGDPAVMLDVTRPWTPPPEHGPNPTPSSLAFQIGRITERGYVPIAALPPATWTIAHEGLDAIAPEWDLHASRDGALWQAHCAWGSSADGSDQCAASLYARLAPLPLVVTTEYPELPTRLEPPALVPPSVPRVTRVERAFEEHTVKVLACSSPAATIEYPSGELEPGFGGISAPIWLSVEPPIFAVERAVIGLAVTIELVIFEGCTPSSRYDAFVAGPAETVALYGRDALTVLWRGRALGTTEGGDRVVFARP